MFAYRIRIQEKHVWYFIEHRKTNFVSFFKLTDKKIYFSAALFLILTLISLPSQVFYLLFNAFYVTLIWFCARFARGSIQTLSAVILRF